MSAIPPGFFVYLDARPDVDSVLVLLEKPILGSRLQVASWMLAKNSNGDSVGPVVAGRFAWDAPKILAWTYLPDVG